MGSSDDCPVLDLTETESPTERGDFYGPGEGGPSQGDQRETGRPTPKSGIWEKGRG